MDDQVAPLEIPERALKAACQAYDDALDHEFREYGTVVHEGEDHAEQAAVRAAAPIIVAAELRRMLNEDVWPCRCTRCIRDRADELDPEGAQ